MLAACAARWYDVLRHIPTDSITEEQAQRSLAPGAEATRGILECGFTDPAARALAVAGSAWRAFEAALADSGGLLFAFDVDVHAPIPPVGSSREGGFRRWMLLRRAAASADVFREAWFGRHAALVRHLPRVQGYLQQLVVARYGPAMEGLDYAAMPVDGIAELCFADEAAMAASYASDARLPLRDDGRVLLAGNVTVLVQGRAFR